MVSLSSSDDASMKDSDQSSSSDMPWSSSILPSSSNGEILLESIPDYYKDNLVPFSLMTTISIDILNNHCRKLFECTAIRQSDMDSYQIYNCTQKKRDLSVI